MAETPTNNHKLWIGLALGVIAGVLAGMFGKDLLPKATPFVYGAVIGFFGLALVIFFVLTLGREWLMKKYLGRVIEFDNVGEDLDKLTTAVSDKVFDILLAGKDKETKESYKSLAPRLLRFFIWGGFRDWGFRVAIMLFTAVGALLGTRLLFQKNKLLEAQNKKFDIQTNLPEVTRRSAYNFQLGAIMEAVKNELDTIPKGKPRVLSDQLIAWMAGWSLGVRPYRYLEGNDLIDESLSPERGQLLLMLVNLNLDTTETWKEIARRVTFNYSDLQYAPLISAALNDLNLNLADLSSTDLRRADLRRTNLWRTDLSVASLDDAILSYAILWKANLRGADLRRADLRGAVLNGADLRGAILNGANLENVQGITYKSLSQVETLYKCKNIPPELEKELREKNPELFEIPRWLIDDE